MFFFSFFFGLSKTAQENSLSGYEWAQDTGHGSWDRVSTAEQSAVASVPKHEKFSAAAAVSYSLIK